MTGIRGALWCLVLTAAPALAEVTMQEADACVAARIDAGQSPMACIDDAHFDCAQVPRGTPNVASLCYTRAREAWDAGIAAEMTRIIAKAPEAIATIAAIELKYDLLSSMTQCDRLEELALAVSSEPPEAILRQKSQCAATASGLAYLRLTLRAKSLD